MKRARIPGDPLVLALETATPVCAVALVSADGPLMSSTMAVGLRHSELLFTEIERILGTARTSLDEVSHVAVSIGPGSFTGLRIGLSAAKGMCLAGDKPLIPVPTLEALAVRVPYAAARVCALLDARKSEVYAALFDTSEGTPRPLDAPRAIRPEELARGLAQDPTIFVGPGVRVFADILAGEAPPAWRVSCSCCYADAVSVGLLAVAAVMRDAQAGLRGRDMEMLGPNYLRLPDIRQPAVRGSQH